MCRIYHSVMLTDFNVVSYYYRGFIIHRNIEVKIIDTFLNSQNFTPTNYTSFLFVMPNSETATFKKNKTYCLSLLNWDLCGD